MKTYTFAQPEIQTYYNNTGVNARSIMSGREWPDKHELTHNYEFVETVMALEHAFARCRSSYSRCRVDRSRISHGLGSEHLGERSK